MFGDEFSGRSVETVVRQVDAVNRAGASGERLVRIHAVGFPFLFRGSNNIPPTAYRFSQLMRVLCERNGGTFVALTDYDRRG